MNITRIIVNLFVVNAANELCCLGNVHRRRPDHYQEFPPPVCLLFLRFIVTSPHFDMVYDKTKIVQGKEKRAHKSQ